VNKEKADLEARS